MNNLVLRHDLHKFISGCAGAEIPYTRYQIPILIRSTRVYFGVLVCVVLGGAPIRREVFLGQRVDEGFMRLIQCTLHSFVKCN